MLHSYTPHTKRLSLNTKPLTLDPQPSSLDPRPFTSPIKPAPSTRTSHPSTLSPRPIILHPEPLTLIHNLWYLNLKSEIWNLKPKTQKIRNQEKETSPTSLKNPILLSCNVSVHSDSATSLPLFKRVAGIAAWNLNPDHQSLTPYNYKLLTLNSKLYTLNPTP